MVNYWPPVATESNLQPVISNQIDSTIPFQCLIILAFNTQSSWAMMKIYILDLNVDISDFHEHSSIRDTNLKPIHRGC